MTSPGSPRLLRAGAVAVGALALAGCAAGTAPGSEAEAEAPAGGPYADGTYTADGSYATPESIETISVTVTLEGEVVTDVEVTGDPQKPDTVIYQGQFIGGIAEVVVGKRLDEISVSRVAGSSLTSGGFMQALEKIRAEATQ